MGRRRWDLLVRSSVSLFALTRTVRDAAAYLDATAGNLPGDPYTPPRPEGTWLAGLQRRPERLRIGYSLAANWGPPFAPEVLRVVQDTVTLLESLGHALLRHDLATPLEDAWRSYNDVAAVQTALDFDMLAPGDRSARARDRSDGVQLVAVATRAGCLSATQLAASVGDDPNGEPKLAGRACAIRRLPNPDADAAAAAGRILGPG